MHVFRDVAPDPRLLPRLAEVARAVGILELDHVTVKDIARARAGADLTRSHAVGADGMAVQDPIGHIDLVAGLFDEMIAAQPAEQVPVADLVLHLAHLRRLGGARPGASHVEIRPHEPYLADRTVADPLDLFQIQRLMPPLQPDYDRQMFRFG